MLIAKVKAFLLHLYPELRRFNIFKQIQLELSPHLDPRMKVVLRFSLPVFILVVILGIGLPLGSFIVGLFSPRLITPPPLGIVTPVVTSSYQSPFIPLKKTIENFSLILPDPAPPLVDNNIILDAPDQ